MADGVPKFSFGFSKSKAPKKFTYPSKLSDDQEKVDNTLDYLISFEDCAPQSLVKTQADFLIPLKLSRNNIREQLKKKYAKVEPGDELTAEALKALMNRDPIDADPSNVGDSNFVVSLPPNAHIDDAEDATEADYAQVPIEKFGMALLKGMGLKDDDIKQASSDDYASKLRLKGLGLGADPKVLLKSRQDAKNAGCNSNEKLTWKEGARCQVIYGRHDGLYGVIQGVDGDTGRVIVKLTSTKQVIKVMQATVRLTSTAEYEKFSNYLNQTDVNRYKESEEKINQTARPSNDADENVCSEKRRRLEEPVMEYSSYETSSPVSTWLQKGLVVRCIDKESKYYLQKVKVLSVVSASSTRSCRCSCETESGRTLKDVRERDLQTTVPKRSGQLVVVVRGDYVDEVCDLVVRDEKTSMANVALRSNGKKILLSFDDVCAFEK